MYYYRDHIPSEGEIVIAKLQPEKESEHCLYAILPEYAGATAIIQKSELPKRTRTRKKILSRLRQAGTVPCIVSVKPIIEADGSPGLIELSMRGVDKDHTDTIVNRYRNIKRLLKIVKFVSIEFKLDFYEIADGLYDEIVTPLVDIDEEKGVSDFMNTYHGFLMDHQSFADSLNINEIQAESVTERLDELINEVESSSSLDFDLAVWKSENKDAIFAIRDMFEHVRTVHPTIELGYVGAPTYRIALPSIKAKLIDQTYVQIKETITQWMKDNGVTGYGLNFDPSTKEIRQGDVSISFPYEINMRD